MHFDPLHLANLNDTERTALFGSFEFMGVARHGRHHTLIGEPFWKDTLRRLRKMNLAFLLIKETDILARQQQ